MRCLQRSLGVCADSVPLGACSNSAPSARVLTRCVCAVQSVATVTAAAGPQVLKIALPIGKQLLGLSAKAIVAGVSAVTAATNERQKQIDKKRKD